MSQSITEERPDIINQLAGLTPGSPIAELRNQRPEVVRYTQGSYDALLEPEQPGGFSRSERDQVALRVALLLKHRTLAEHHRQRLRQAGASDELITFVEQFPAKQGAPRQLALLRHVDLLTTRPRVATPVDLEVLTSQGFSPADIVTIAQLIAFVNYQIVVLNGLRLLQEER